MAVVAVVVVRQRRRRGVPWLSARPSRRLRRVAVHEVHRRILQRRMPSARRLSSSLRTNDTIPSVNGGPAERMHAEKNGSRVMKRMETAANQKNTSRGHAGLHPFGGSCEESAGSLVLWCHELSKTCRRSASLGMRGDVDPLPRRPV